MNAVIRSRLLTSVATCKQGLLCPMLFSGYTEKVAGTTPGYHTVPCRQTARSPFHQIVPLRGKRDRPVCSTVF